MAFLQSTENIWNSCTVLDKWCLTCYRSPYEITRTKLTLYFRLSGSLLCRSEQHPNFFSFLYLYTVNVRMMKCRCYSPQTFWLTSRKFGLTWEPFNMFVKIAKSIFPSAVVLDCALLFVFVLLSVFSGI